MNNNLDTILVNRYPKIFKDRFGNMQQTSMCWGFECGDGWFDLIDQLCSSIQSYTDYQNSQRVSLLNSNPYNATVPDEVLQVVASQVKEKMGTLCFYYSGGDNYINELVCTAESASSVTCDVCGAPGTKMQHRGWVQTRCQNHING